MPIMGGLSDKYGRRIFIASGLLLLAVISLLYLPAHNEYTLTAVRLLNGLAAGMIIPVAMAYAGEVAQEGKEGKTRGIFNSTISLGIIVAPLMSGVVMDYSGINSVFYFAGIVSLLFTLIGCYYVWKWSKANK